MEFAYRKSLGQNFIYDLSFLRALVGKLNVAPDDLVVEVGAGAGTLTQVLAETGCRVQTYEIDQRLRPVLAERLGGLSNVTVNFADALRVDFTAFSRFRLIANVPYYITTPLISQFLALPSCTDVNVLVAREVAERIVAPVGTAAYGALSVMCQLVADCTILQDVPRTMFTPRPQVDSAFVCLRKRGLTCPAAFGQMLKAVFAGRRKTVLNALTRYCPDKATATHALQTAGIDLGARAEQIPPTKFWEIWQNLTNSPR